MTMGAGRYPDFFLVGAAKSGTTSLFRYLIQHPSIFIPRDKELHYFADPSVSHGGGYRTLEAYQGLFKDCPEDVRAGDASTSYLPSPSAAMRIREARADAKILILLRNPVDRAYSHYWHQRVGFGERLSFEDALAEEPRRIARGRTYGFRYVQTGMYYQQVKRFVDVFGDNVQVHLLEDLRSDADALCRIVFAFLDVDPGRMVDTESRYRRRGGPPRSKALSRLLARRLPGSRWLARRWPERTGALKLAMSQWNATRPPPMAADTRRRLVQAFRTDVERLQELLGRDLSAWLTIGGEDSA